MRRLGLGLLLAAAAWPAAAQSVNIDLGAAGQPGATMRLVQLTALIGEKPYEIVAAHCAARAALPAEAKAVHPAARKQA